MNYDDRHRYDAPRSRYNNVPYRSRRGVFLGVCRGLAQHFDFSVTGMRLLFIVATPLTGFWPMLAGYLLAALLMRVEPMVPLNSEEDAEFYNSYTASRQMALLRLKRTYDHLERRIQRLESAVTSRDFDWDRRLNGR
jgi:phage shock protein C